MKWIDLNKKKPTKKMEYLLRCHGESEGLFHEVGWWTGERFNTPYDHMPKENGWSLRQDEITHYAHIPRKI